ncbi:MAG: AAA family ATPase, partial [Azonexaceae bacterium]|nr:AAA family ATPase [Azonexaceae bacterium]
MTAGFHPGNLVIIAGRPSMGKTALAMNIAQHAAGLAKDPVPVLVVSLEMGKEELALRLLASEARVNAGRMKTGFFKDEDWPRLMRGSNSLSQSKMYIDDSSNLTVLEMRSKARRQKAETGLGMVIVDYLQLMKGGEFHERRDLEVAYVSRSLKALAKELDIPVVACAQLNRGTEQRGKESRPQLSDLRESGAIEQDADVVMFVHRPIMSIGKKIDETDPEYQELKLEAEVIIGKQRNGPIGRVDLVFKNEFAKFENKLVKPVLNYELKPAPTVSPAITLRSFLDFYIPLAMTSLLFLLAQPIGSAALSRMPNALASLAVWP